jgi:2-methylcitrate dehydratase PrpD
MKTGFHPTSVCGVFGATLAAARLRGLTETPTTYALGIAGSMASGLFEYLSDGSTTKAVNAGWAAHGGVLAALLAEAGGDGPVTVLEGRFGVFATHFRLEFRGSLGDEWGLGTRWETPAISFKPYPACHFIHTALDVARSLLDDGLDPLELDDVLVAVPEPAVPLVLEPWPDKIRPRTPFDAKFSLPYSLAAMFLRGEVGIDTYAPAAIADDQVLDLAARVRYEIEEFPSYPTALPARVTVTTRDGERLTRVRPEGSSHAPIDQAKIVSKYRVNAELALSSSDALELESALLGLEEHVDLSSALASIRRAQRRC